MIVGCCVGLLQKRIDQHRANPHANTRCRFCDNFGQDEGACGTKKLVEKMKQEEKAKFKRETDELRRRLTPGKNQNEQFAHGI